MNVKSMLYTTSIAAGIGLAGLLGTGIATANAAPALSDGSGARPAATGTQQSGPKVKLTHHQRKEALKQDAKELKKPQQITPTDTRHHL